MKKKKLPKRNPIANALYNGETGFKSGKRVHKSKKKYTRKGKNKTSLN